MLNHWKVFKYGTHKMDYTECWITMWNKSIDSVNFWMKSAYKHKFANHLSSRYIMLIFPIYFKYFSPNFIVFCRSCWWRKEANLALTGLKLLHTVPSWAAPKQTFQTKKVYLIAVQFFHSVWIYQMRTKLLSFLELFRILLIFWKRNNNCISLGCTVILRSKFNQKSWRVYMWNFDPLLSSYEDTESKNRFISLLCKFSN